MIRHVPVLCEEIVKLLCCRPAGVYVDCTLGDGGHAEAILKQSDGKAKVVGIDRDGEAVQFARQRLKKYGSSCRIVRDNFRNLTDILDKLHLQEVDGIFFDLGVSSLQLDKPERGFSFRFDVPLDMRMDRRDLLKASHLINQSSREKLKKIFKDFGDEKKAGRIASLIVSRRKREPIRTTGQFVELVEEIIPHRKDKIHPATRVFQALRIAVNDEFEALREGLNKGIKVLKPGGRLAVISYQSLDDRLVKQTFQEWVKDCHCPPRLPVCNCGGGKRVALIITKRIVRPSEEEILNNPRSRSAKLRVAEKI